IAEIELVEVALQVLLAAALVDAFHAALEDRKEALDRIRVDVGIVALNVLARAVRGLAVALEVAGGPAADAGIDPAFIGHERAALGDVGLNDTADGLGGSILDLEGSGSTAALDQRYDLALTASALVGPSAAHEIGFVGLDGRAGSAHRTSASLVVHGLAQAVHHEPSRFVGDAKHAVHLVRRNALLGGAEQEGSHKPFVERHMGALEQRSDHDRELLTAGIALVVARTGGDSGCLGDCAAIAADRALRPEMAFEPGSGFVGILENRILEFCGHGGYLSQRCVRAATCRRARLCRVRKPYRRSDRSPLCSSSDRC